MSEPSSSIDTINTTFSDITSLPGEDQGFRVNSTTTGTQNNTNWQRLPNGGFAILYDSNDTPANGLDVRIRFFNKLGQATGQDVVVNQTLAGNQSNGAMVALNSGNLLVTWHSFDTVNTTQGQLFGRLYSSDGIALGNEFQMSSNGADGAYAILQRSNGTIVVAYQNDGEITGRTFSEGAGTLTALSAETQLNTTLPGTPTSIRLQGLSNGNVMLAFTSPENAAPPTGNGYDLRNRVFNMAGNIFTPVSISGSTNDYLVNTTLAGDQSRVRQTRLANGDLLEVWDSTDTGDGSGRCIRGRVLSADGTPTGSDFIVNTTVTGDQRQVNITAFDDGRRLIHWRSFEGGTLTIRGRWVWADSDADGAGATPNDGNSNVDWSSNDFVIGTLPDTSGGGYGIMLLSNQLPVLIYEGIGADDDYSPTFSNGVTASLISQIGGVITPTTWDGELYENLDSIDNVLNSPLDLNLPSFTYEQAGQQISRNITANNNFNDAIGTSHVITYAYRDSIENWTYANGATGFGQFTAQQIAVAETAIQLWEDVANIDFVRVQTNGAYSNNANLLLWNYSGATAGTTAASSSGFGGWNAGANPSDTSGYGYRHFVYLNGATSWVTAPTVDNLGQRLMLHEIGHAIGLSHPGDYNVTSSFQSYASDASYKEDNMRYTLMSYFDESVGHADYGSTGMATPLLNDIAAMQRLYGANMTTRTGNTVYGFNSNTGRSAFTLAAATDQRVFAVWDAGGVDTFDFSGYSMTQLIDLREEKFSWTGGLTANVAIAKGAVIENAIGGSGNDMMLGNAAANTLTGGAGDDTLDGSTGIDILLGGLGDDELNNADGLDTLNGGDGIDTARIDRSVSVSNLTYDFTNAPTSVTLSDGTTLISIESIDIRGGSGNDQFTGTSGNDDMEGGAGLDVLSGQGGIDYLNGGDGNDTLYGGDDGDMLSGGDGTDWLYGGAGDDNLMGDMQPEGNFSDWTVTFAMGTATDALFGEAGNDVLNGQGGGDSLDGGIGNDSLFGGAGIDWLYGGDGNDFLDGGTETDALFGQLGDDNLNGGGGDDNLNGGDGIDNLQGGLGVDWLYGGNGNDYLDGGDQTDALFGDADNDTLHGGNGDDGLNGGVGDDWLYGDAGIDWLYGATGNDNLYGGSETDALFGEAGADVLWGGDGGDNLDGGIGVDTLNGDAGVDWLYGGADNDVLYGGADGDQLFGEDGNDMLYGDAGNDGLDGGMGNDFLDGGAGNDVLIGYFGNDTFRLHNNAADQDIIKDFETGIDKVHLNATEFGIVAGNYTFQTGAGLPASLTGTAPVLYFETGGRGLWFDPTGGTTVDIIKIGGLETGTIAATDIVVL